MNANEKELEKINNNRLKLLEKTLAHVDRYEQTLKIEFDSKIVEILDDIAKDVFEEISKMSNIDKISTKIIKVDGKPYKVPTNFLQVFHKSYIENPDLRIKFEEKLKAWFSEKTNQIRDSIKDKDSYEEMERALPPAYALASLALTAFHKHPNMILRDVQKLTGIAISEGNIAELGTGEGKTLSAVLPVYLQALRGKGAHVITANGYLARRDFEETLPIFEGLGLTSGFVPDSIEELAIIEGKDPDKITNSEILELQKKLKVMKQDAYRKDITYGAKQTFAFDYLRDNLIKEKDDMVQRVERPGFALIDEVDDVLIDDAEVPYRVASDTPTYRQNMTIRDLCIIQDISYDETLPKIRELGIESNLLTYEEARYISKMFGKYDLLPDPRKYQEAADRFFRLQKVLVAEDNMYGFSTGKELFKALTDDEKYDSEEIKRKYGILYCKELKEFRISDKCYEDFLKYCYFSFQINAMAIKNQRKIINDPNYKDGVDYNINTATGKLKLTLSGANRILNDENYSDFIEDFNAYLSTISQESALLLHYFHQAVVAHLIMKNGEDYIIENGKIKTLKNGRIQEDSKYSNGLHQALEIKERIPLENRSKETSASSTITQKDFYSRYDMFSGMTGTSSKDVFQEIFGKETIEIPKHAFYSFYGKRKLKSAREPIGVLKKDVSFTLSKEDKIGLIVKSIKESQSQSPKQPILLVVSDVDEIILLQNALQKENIRFNTLTATTSKEDEALIIARAGLPGAVTISTEMAGRGTDIRVGGDRETIIDIATLRHIRAIEKAQKHKLNFSTTEKEILRKKVEKALLDAPNIKLWTKDDEKRMRASMETIGLKVISSGFFGMTRIDRQLEGRTGRNGISGVCERFACPDDIKRLGLTSFNVKDSILDSLSKFPRRSDGSLAIDENSYKTMMSKIISKQKNNESDVKERIKQSQRLDSFATSLVESYREQRRKIVTDQEDVHTLADQMIEQACDAIISSYIINKEIKESQAKVPINKSGIEMNIEGLCLEMKQILGIAIDPSVVSRSNISLLELREAVVRTAKERHERFALDKDKDALIIQNDFIIANIPDILEHSFIARRLTGMSMGMEGQADYVADMEFNKSRRRLIMEACKEGLRTTMGLPLSKEEFKRLETIRSKLYTMVAVPVKEPVTPQKEVAVAPVAGNIETSQTQKALSFEVKEAKFEKNNVSMVDKLRAIKKKVDKKNNKQIEQAEKKIEQAQERGREIDVKALYTKLQVRPLKFISAMTDGKTITKLVIVRQRKEEEIKKATLH